MVTAEAVCASDLQLANIVSICNQPTIYWLFKEKLGGRPYETAQASDFLKWAKRGWNEQTHFVFLLTDADGMVAGALDIKSSDRSKAEIGYWCSELHRGLMSNAVSHLVELAEEAGFLNLYARVRKDNASSQKVLERNKFQLVGDWPDDPSRVRFELKLGGAS